MNVVAETPRLRLRRVVPADAPGFFELSRDPEVLRYTGQLPMQEFAEAEALVSELIERYARSGYGRWVVERREDGEFLGWCGLRLLEGEGVDLGYWLLPRHWGQGYAKESAHASVALGFGTYRLPFLIGRAVAENMASCTVLERLGFEPWYRLADWGYDDVRYTVLRRPDAPTVDASLGEICREGDLRARFLQPEDQLDFYLLEGNPNILRYADGTRVDFDAAGRSIARLRQDGPRKDAKLRVFAVSDGTRPFLGTVALVRSGNAVEIGCRLLEAVHRQGLGRPLARLNLALARQEYPDRRIHARIDLRNEPSLRMVAGLGGRREPDADGHAHYVWDPIR